MYAIALPAVYGWIAEDNGSSPLAQVVEISAFRSGSPTEHLGGGL